MKINKNILDLLCSKTCVCKLVIMSVKTPVCHIDEQVFLLTSTNNVKISVFYINTFDFLCFIIFYKIRYIILT